MLFPVFKHNAFYFTEDDSVFIAVPEHSDKIWASHGSEDVCCGPVDRDTL
jgi:hypothetical protein